MGEIDELNSAIGLLIAFDDSMDTTAEERLIDIQQDLLDLGGELSIPGYELLKVGRVASLEEWLASMNASLPRLQEFVRPGGSIPAAQAHMCRTICRRAERALVELAEVQEVSQTARQYLNRLSDLMFVVARVMNQRAGQAESMWNRQRSL